MEGEDDMGGQSEGEIGGHGCSVGVASDDECRWRRADEQASCGTEAGEGSGRRPPDRCEREWYSVR